MIHFFTDPVLRAPTIGSILMALCASLVGVLLFVRKRTLVGEALSHASYPGVTLAIFLAPFLRFEWAILLGAFLSALAGFWLINFLKTQLRVKEDAALCFVLATFFGIGTTIASLAQAIHPAQIQQIQVFLYGQAATMTEQHVMVYGGLAGLIVLLLILFYRQLLVLSFDPKFGQTNPWVERCFVAIVALAVVIGIRSVGVIMMAALFIAPPIAARQFTNRLPYMFMLSAIFGVLSGFLGNVFSASGLPTGPMIVIVASFFALSALLFAPNRGLIIRYIRILRFRFRSHEENLLKALWRQKELAMPWWIRLHLRFLGFLDREGQLTAKGKRRGAHIVRLHRLWEAYLVYSLGMGSERVHQSAEEMEHLLTDELEEELSKLLDNPREDPHAQPIPPREVLS